MRFFFEIWESLFTAFRAINANKLRSILTTLGIVIGITSVTAMATVINGIEREFEEDMAELGTDVLYIEKWPWASGPGFKWWNYINRPEITEDLVEVIDKRSKYAVATVPVANTSRTVRFNENTLSGVRIQGASATYPDVFNVSLESGRYYNDIEDRTGRMVCIIGSGIASVLFPVEEPVGKYIRVSGFRMQVIGVLEQKGSNAEGQDSDDMQVQIPFTAFKNSFGVARRSISVRVKVGSSDYIEDARDELTGILRAARKLDPTEENDFEINEQKSLREQLAPVKTTIYLIGIFLTALSLLVGGIGVMNIMFVSVKERTKEIGIRKAVGAKRRTILLQFMIEAIAICMIGGLLGTIIASGLIGLINLILPAVLPVSTVAVAFLICVLVGVIFGLAPAWSAAKEEPIEALRYE